MSQPEPRITVYLTNSTRTSAGPGPGPKSLPAGEAAWPRIVLTGVNVPGGSPNYPGAPPNLIWVRPGTAVDIKPGSALEQLYGAANLSPVITHTGDPGQLRQVGPDEFRKGDG